MSLFSFLKRKAVKNTQPAPKEVDADFSTVPIVEEEKNADKKPAIPSTWHMDDTEEEDWQKAFDLGGEC